VTESNPPTDAPRRPTHSMGPVHPLGVAVLGGAIASLATFVVAIEITRQRRVEASAQVSPVAVATVPRTVQRAVFFDNEVKPCIDATDQLNRESAVRCIIRLRQVFRDYQRGVEPFVEDLTSISTRLGIVRRMPGNWWTGDSRIETYVQQKFETHLFSQQRLCSDVSEVLERFRQEIDANQRRMLIDVRASLDTADLPEIQVDQYDAFFQSVAQRLQGYSADQGTTSVYNALTVLIISEAGSYAAIAVVAGLLARFGSAAAVSAAAGVGATAGATATGAGTGSLAGPVGTAVGLGVGLAVGLIIDWWMTDRFEAEMNQQMTAYLQSLEATMLRGSPEHSIPSGSSHGDSIQSSQSPELSHSVGLVQALPELCGGLVVAYRERFYEQIVTGEEVE
jgi:hypothetical protein